MAKNASAYYTAKEAAALLGIAVGTLYVWARKAPEKGAPPVVKFGTQCVRFPRKEFDKWAKLTEQRIG